MRSPRQKNPAYHRSANFHSLPTSSNIPTALTSRELYHFNLQILSFQLIYAIQGTFFSLLGPSLGYFSVKSPEIRPVASFGPIFASQSASFLLTNFISQFLLHYPLEKNKLLQVTVLLLIISSIWFALVTPCASIGGSMALSLFFAVKGFLFALLNTCVNACVFGLVQDEESARKQFVSLNVAFGFGAVLGSPIALFLFLYSIELEIAFQLLAVLMLVPTFLLVLVDLHAPSNRIVPTVLNPTVGGMLGLEQIMLHKHAEKESYDAGYNFIVLLVTIISSVFLGAQTGIAAFLYDYIALIMDQHASILVLNERCVMLMALFWAAMWCSQCAFLRIGFENVRMTAILYLSLSCMFSAFGILCGDAFGIMWFTLCLVAFGVSLAPLFMLSLELMKKVVSAGLLYRAPPLIAFGAGMGEIFIPVLMGFFMGDYSGEMYGAAAVSYILNILVIVLALVCGVLYFSVQNKMKVRQKSLRENTVVRESRTCALQKMNTFASYGATSRIRLESKVDDMIWGAR